MIGPNPLESRHLLQLVLDSVGEGIVVADRAGKFLLWNPPARHLIPAGPSDVPPEEWSRFYSLLDPETREQIATEQLPLVRALHGESVDDFEMITVDHTDHSERRISVTARPMFGEDGELCGAVAVFRDVGDRHRLLEQLHRSNDALRAYAQSVSHDLKSPLTAITGFAEALREDCQAILPHAARGHLKEIENAATRMARLIDDLLEHARLGDGWDGMVDVDLDPLLDNVLHNLAADLQGRDAAVAVERPLGTVVGHAIGLQQLLQNLLSNAVKFVPPDRQPQLHVASIADDSWFELQVRDNGVGIDPKYHQHVFDLFRRLHPNREWQGTGIGLALVKKTVELHGGEVLIDSELGRGSTFRVRLPRR